MNSKDNMTGHKHTFLRRFAFFAAVAFSAGMLFLSPTGRFAIASLLGHGGSFWIHFNPGADDNPAWLRAALQDRDIPAVSDAPIWQKPQTGLETATLPVFFKGQPVDTLELIRIDPQHFRFEVHVNPQAGRTVHDWMLSLDPVALVNGSYYGHDGLPSTPLKSKGVRFGPERYSAIHGAFLAKNGRVELRDLAALDWRSLFPAYSDAMVSYPLLVSPDSPARKMGHDDWLANRTFVAIDWDGKVILGTSRNGFFSLKRLARFLREAALGIRYALNLDGGPVACQALKTRSLSRSFCGEWEIASNRFGALKLQPGVRGKLWTLPVILAVFPRNNR